MRDFRKFKNFRFSEVNFTIERFGILSRTFPKPQKVQFLMLSKNQSPNKANKKTAPNLEQF